MQLAVLLFLAMWTYGWADHKAHGQSGLFTSKPRAILEAKYDASTNLRAVCYQEKKVLDYATVFYNEPECKEIKNEGGSEYSCEVDALGNCKDPPKIEKPKSDDK